jgi:hypothetical protein
VAGAASAQADVSPRARAGPVAIGLKRAPRAFEATLDKLNPRR